MLLALQAFIMLHNLFTTILTHDNPQYRLQRKNAEKVLFIATLPHAHIYVGQTICPEGSSGIPLTPFCLGSIILLSGQHVKSFPYILL